jgi:hypothetical protein
VAVAIELGINYSYDKILLFLAGVELVYLLIITIARAYNNVLDNVGVVCCVLTECFSIAMPLVYRYL